MADTRCIIKVMANMKGKNRAKKSIKSAQSQTGFGMTIREYRETPEYAAKAEQEFKENIQPELDRIADQVREVMNPVLLGITEAAASITWPTDLFKGLSMEKDFFIPVTPSPEVRIENAIRRFESKFDKDSGSAKINIEVKNKNANCRFCGRTIMRVEEISHLIKATTKCPECQKVVKIPEDLAFKDIIN